MWSGTAREDYASEISNSKSTVIAHIKARLLNRINYILSRKNLTAQNFDSPLRIKVMAV